LARAARVGNSIFASGREKGISTTSLGMLVTAATAPESAEKGGTSGTATGSE
jgi:hypothetical protein